MSPDWEEDEGSELSRREFLQSSATGAAVTGSAQSSRGFAFQADARPVKLSENLFFLEDTCNVYLIRRNHRAVIVDFGSGKILDHLRDLGIAQVDWILHTHHHRDQAQGDLLAIARKIPIAVPEFERQFFEDAENFWRNRRIFELYDVKNDFFSLTRNVPVSSVLHDYQTFQWQGLDLFIQPTPGHTPGSISVIADIDGKRVAFSGDLIHSAGKVQTLYDLQYYYQEHEGVDLSIYSLSALINLKPQLLCPSHGAPISEPAGAMAELSRKLTAWHHYWYKHPPTSEIELAAISPHLIANTEATSSFYTIISDSGKALFIDYGGASWTFFQVFTRYVDTFGRMRFLEHSIEKLRARHGLRSIDVAIPSHMHDDHLNGLPYLVRRYGTKVWAYENMVEILQNPRALNVGCIFGEPIRVDRALHHRETFKWEEFEFTAVHSPGHTNYQMALFTTIDKTRVAFTGDAFFDDAPNPKSLRHNLIYRNEVKSEDHLKSIRNVLEFDPQMIAPGHGKPFPVDRETARNFERRAAQQDFFFRSLVANPDTDFGLDPSWVRIQPYQIRAVAGEEQSVQIRVRNHGRKPMRVEARLVLPPGWRAGSQPLTLSIGAGADAQIDTTFTVPGNWSGTMPRVAIALDVVVNGKHVGQIAEAVVDLRSHRT
jgi:glyoxylase-like metal-dependent hydrolase (beta-lactamase superfamily II)